MIPLTLPGRICNYCIGYWEAGTKESLITLVVRSFVHVSHVFLHSDLLEVRHHMHTNATYMFAFSIIHFAYFWSAFWSFCNWQTILSWLKLNSLPRRQLYLFRFERRSCSFGGRFTEKDRKRFILFDKNVKHKLVAFPK